MRNHHQKKQKHHQKRQKNILIINRVYAQKISPDAKTKKQSPRPRRGHQTGEIPAMIAGTIFGDRARVGAPEQPCSGAIQRRGVGGFSLRISPSSMTVLEGRRNWAASKNTAPGCLLRRRSSNYQPSITPASHVCATPPPPLAPVLGCCTRGDSRGRCQGRAASFCAHVRRGARRGLGGI